MHDRLLFVFIRLHSADGNEDRVVRALETVTAASRAEPGCVSIDAFRSTADSRLFFIHSVWRDAAAFELHATLPHTVQFSGTVDPLLDEPRTVHRTVRVE